MSDGPDVAIVGVGESDLGMTDKIATELQVQAAMRAIEDAGLSLRDVDGVATNGSGTFPASSLSEELGLTPAWIDDTSAGGASWLMFIADAVAAIHTGACTTVLLAYGSNQRSGRTRSLGGTQFVRNDPPAAFEVPFAPLVPLSPYALAATRHMHEFGTTSEQLAEVAVSAREWALKNPAAFRYGDGPLTIDEVLTSPIVSSPLHTRDCCLVTDGGGAVVLTSADRARSLRKPPVSILGYGGCVDHAWGIAATPDLVRTGAWNSARRAYAMAGLGPADIDVVQLYDSFTITVLLTLEALQFCEPGEAGPFVADGRTRPGGAFPLNTSGGGLSYCHPGQFGVFLVIEAVRQLRGESADRQILGAEVALCHGTGGILSQHATTILGRPR
jgi:acetyl-CoA acetyltransferase